VWPVKEPDVVGLNTLTPKEVVSQNHDAIRHLKQAVSAGKHWCIALLEAIGLWTAPEETYQGLYFQYLVGGEAFDWLLLAQRLLLEIEGQFPMDEAEALLFQCKAPLALSPIEFRRLVGATKYRAHLNFLYGVVVEQALRLAVVEEVRKERRSIGLGGESGVDDEAYIRIYGQDMRNLLEDFRADTGQPNRLYVDIAELKEFTYWSFKQRLKLWDPSRVASDTKKGLEVLRRHWASSKFNWSRTNCLFWPPSPSEQFALEAAPACPAE
jgi:hypothetical protein